MDGTTRRRSPGRKGCHYRKLRPDTQTSIDQVMQCQRSCVNRLRSHHKE